MQTTTRNTSATSKKTKLGATEGTKKELLTLMKEQGVRFLRMQFTDIMGVIKNVEIPDVQFEKALNNEILFDGSSIDGFSRIEESDMLLYPDPATFRVFPWVENAGKKDAGPADPSREHLPL